MNQGHSVSIKSELDLAKFSDLLTILKKYGDDVVSHRSQRQGAGISGLALTEVQPLVMDSVLGVTGSLPKLYSFTLVFYPDILDPDTKSEIMQLLRLA